MTQPPRFPFSTTFVSPVTMLTCASLHACSMLSKILSRSARAKPSSNTKPEASAYGSAPIIAMSLTVPEMDRRPISPPGKNIGLTAWESLLRTTSPTTAASSIASRGTSAMLAPPKCLTMRFFTKSCMTVPPAPCNMVMYLVLPDNSKSPWTLNIQTQDINASKRQARSAGVQSSSND